jgi:hypothetical protein
MMYMQKEIPLQPEKPEIMPPQEPEEPEWPKREPEIIPEKEPGPGEPPQEIPLPPERNRKLNSLIWTRLNFLISM